MEPLDVTLEHASGSSAQGLSAAAASRGGSPEFSSGEGGPSPDSSAALTPIPRVVVGPRRRFDEETALVLRGRLRAVYISLLAVLSLAFASSLVTGGVELWGLRLAILLVIAVVWQWLQRSDIRSLFPLRCAELGLFALVSLQLALVMISRSLFLVREQDAVSLASTLGMFYTGFCVLVLTYGIFMPNTWRRAALVMGAIGLVPLAVSGWLRWREPGFAALVARNHATSPVPMTLVAAAVGTFGSHVIHRARREAFRARQFLQYQLKEPIGGGGMGDVYRAEHVLLKRPCAMKLIKPDRAQDREALLRFEREVIATASLSHWNTIDIYDYGHTDDGKFYYVMELLHGRPLDQVVARHGPMPPARATYLLQQICDALAEAHARGLVHRDIKPGNIFLSRQGGVWDVVKLLDFGLVALRNQAAAEGEGIGGTPLYMAPEQIDGKVPPDPRSDLYAMGCVAHFLITGEAPFSSGGVMQVLYAHRHTPPPELIGKTGPASDELRAIVARLLAKSPADRFASAGDVRDALSRCPEDGQWDRRQAAAWWEAHEPALAAERTAA